MSNLLPYVQSQGYFQAEWSYMLFLLAVGTLYFLAPVVGYLPGKRGLLVASMWAIVCKLAIGIFRDCLVGVQSLYAPANAAVAWNVGPAGAGAPNPPPNLFFAASGSTGFFGKLEEQLPALLSLTEMAAFLAALILFVLGLQRLVRREPLPREAPTTVQER